MNDYYIRYSRSESVKYVSHLDFVRVFGRAMRRAQLPIAYSEGFNPHPLLTFALPLSVGYTSRCELLEIVLSEPVSTDIIAEKLNEVLPEGIRVDSVHEGRSHMKKLDIACYHVFPENMPESVDAFFALSEILVDKKTKSGIKETDIRPDIKELKPAGEKIEMVLAAGSRANLKPETVIQAMNKYISGYNSGDCEYCRVAVFDAEMNEI